MASKMVQKVSGNRYFWRHFSKVDFLIHFGRPLSHFGCPLAHLWFPFGSPWLPFGSLWLPFGSLLMPFGSLLVPLGSLLLTLTLDVHTFAVSWRMFNNSWNFRWVSYVNSYLFEKSSLKCSLFVMFFFSAAKHPKTIPGTRTPPSFGHGAETCRRQPLFLGSSFQSWGRRNRVA